MPISAEEQRALDFQQTLINRARNKAIAEAALRCDPIARRRLEERWMPISRRDEPFTIAERTVT